MVIAAKCLKSRKVLFSNIILKLKNSIAQDIKEIIKKIYENKENIHLMRRCILGAISKILPKMDRKVMSGYFFFRNGQLNYKRTQ